MPSCIPPESFGDSVTREQVRLFLEAEPIEDRDDSQSITRIIKKDETGILYVANLKFANPNKNEKRN